MKKCILFLLIGLAAMAGCSRPESEIYGTWKAEGFDFVAEFSNDHTGTSTSAMGKTPFTWMVQNDGRIKIIDQFKKDIFLKFREDSLKIDGSNLTLTKIK
ncbi:hypothetical protein F6V30_07325 [Oryzomonas sagensis]|uniref:Lipocalin-like domain-containing protein n=1 Tax=Oryzomonas sagensis TaxID=2603857 RepID=A0ABQ6TTL0_9BACT|nr:hypothetical protein [Oryzomonas sagensis]KAB0672366.1 hypothetical protein F6V30_07325 [Oryzomonas sagensis]